MKNVIISFLIFIALIIGMNLSSNQLSSVCSTFLNENKQLEKVIEKENWQKAYDESSNLLNKWESECKILTIFIHHEKIHSVHYELTQLNQYIKCKEKTESLAKIHLINAYLEHIIQSEKVNFQNVF